MNIERHLRGLLVCALLATQSSAVGIPNLRIEELVHESDLIVVADVGDAKDLGPAVPVLFRNQQLQAEEYAADLFVRRIIKGSAPPRIVVNYSLPFTGVGYHGLQPGTRLVFLRREKEIYRPADPYHPDFPATVAAAETGIPSQAGDYAAVVLREMFAVMSSATASPAEKSQILFVDFALPHNDDAIAALRGALVSATEPEFKQRLQGELISFGDLSELPEVAHLLLTNAATDNQKGWLLFVIGYRVTDRRAIPALQPLLVCADDSARKAAVQALWHIADPAALPALAKALGDPNEQVRFYAVRGLSDIANELGWGGPSESQFHEHEQKYLAHWQGWLRAQGLE